jgi:hypothetical protein
VRGKRTCNKCRCSKDLPQDRFQGRIYPTKDETPTMFLECDTSGIGWGGLCREGLDHPYAEAHGFFLDREREQSPTHRETNGMLFTLRSLAGVCAGRKIQVLVDNQSTLPVIWVGSMSSLAMASIAKKTFALCTAIGATLTVVWVPRAQNTNADDISKLEDKDDWQLVPIIFYRLSLRWDPHSCDRFASDLNRHVLQFYSLRWCPGTAGIDAFDRLWGNPLDNNWISPPFSLIGRGINEILGDKAIATVVVPWWTCQVWWHLVAPNGHTLSPLITDLIMLRSGNELFMFGHGSGNSRPDATPRWRVLALRFDARPNARRSRPAFRKLPHRPHGPHPPRR